MNKKMTLLFMLIASAITLLVYWVYPDKNNNAECADILSLSAGGTHALAITSQGTVCAAGSNYLNQLGFGELGAAVKTFTPVPLPGIKAEFSYASPGFSAIVTDSGHIWFWGENSTRSGTVSPRRLEGIDEVKQVALSGAEFIALKRDGSIWGFSKGSWSRIEKGPFLDIDANLGYFVMLAQDGSVKGMGTNTFGQLGAANPELIDSPQKIDGFSNIISIKAGAQHIVALDHEGAVYILGTVRGMNNLPTVLQNPQHVSDLPKIKAVDAGFAHSIAIDEQNHVWTWGEGSMGQLGTGNTSNRVTPYQIPNLQVKAWAAGTLFNLVYSEPKVMLWGSFADLKSITAVPTVLK